MTSCTLLHFRQVNRHTQIVISQATVKSFVTQRLSSGAPSALSGHFNLHWVKVWSVYSGKSKTFFPSCQFYRHGDFSGLLRRFKAHGPPTQDETSLIIQDVTVVWWSSVRHGQHCQCLDNQKINRLKGFVDNTDSTPGVWVNWGIIMFSCLTNMNFFCAPSCRAVGKVSLPKLLLKISISSTTSSVSHHFRQYLSQFYRFGDGWNVVVMRTAFKVQHLFSELVPNTVELNR